MQLGAVFPTCEIGNDPAVIATFAQEAERLGYGHLLVYDHVLGAEHADREPPLAGPYTEHDAFHEPFVLFGYLAAKTTSLELATGVIILPQRQTALVAKQCAELQVLSQGRLRLGVGTGWNPVEYAALNESWASRGPRLDEQVDLMRSLWSGGTVDFAGEYHRVERAGLLPAPDHEIPVWFGGFSPPAIRRAARIGDGFIFGAASGGMQGLCKLLHAELEKNGRDPGACGIETIVSYADGADGWKRARDAWAPLGATHFSMRAMDTGASLMGETPPGFTSPQQHVDALGTFARAME